LLLVTGLLVGCSSIDTGGSGEASQDAALSMADEVRAVIESSGAEVGFYYRSLSEGGDSVMVAPDVRMHAASTMKVPVMMQLFLDDQEGTRSLSDSLLVSPAFRSIVDGSEYDLPRESDSDTTFYDRVGSVVPVRDMVDRMITWSSNLATNILIEVADPARIAELMVEIGADSMSVLRGVEDLKAFEAGLSNSTTARSLGAVMAAVASDSLFEPSTRSAMIDVLARQHFTGGIPSGVPEGVRVANKTGWITGIQHDAAIVFPTGGTPYVLVVLVRGHPAGDQGEAMTAELSAIVWRHHTGAPD
jgi:beta-lactamase class A